ncbi:hypothetical protein B7463_g8903, partial [Scytalidium lignicola]
MNECANPLLLSWVSEWLETARERNSKGVTVYKKAYDSLKSCPLVFNHPAEAQQLHGFGPKLCERLTAKLKDHCEQNGLPMPEMPYKKAQSSSKDTEGSKPAPKVRKTKAYVPTLRSGAYALIVALSTLSEDASMGITKSELIELAQPHSDSSFIAPNDTTKFYTAWNSMKTLIDKDLVYEKGRPLRRYALTEEGWEVAKRIKLTKVSVPSRPANSNNDVVSELSEFQRDSSQQGRPQELSRGQDLMPQGEFISNESLLPSFSPIVVHPGAFSVRLVLDVREVRAKQDRDYMQDELAKRGVTPIMRSLELGDALWVAKCHDPTLLSRLGTDGDEIVLDWIVERKRLDDLVSSIKDGRFHEQKFRLKRSGVKNVIYIIEEFAMNSDHFQKYEEAVKSAIASTQVVSGYFVKKTQKMDDTIRYLTRMTMLLRGMVEKMPLYLIPTKIITMQNYLPLLTHLNKIETEKKYNITYTAFASLASKSESLTLRDIFLKMLMCTRGVTGEKALEIQRRWKTPIEFIEAFNRFGQDGDVSKKRKAELVFSEMGNLVGRKKIAKILSHKIAEVWGDI